MGFLGAGQLNTGKITMDTFITQIKRRLEAGVTAYPIIGLGKGGIGKTTRIHQLAVDNGWKYKELRLIGFRETDLTGLPYLKEGSEAKDGIPTAGFSRVDVLPSASDLGDEDERGILVLDEITSCSEGMSTVLNQLFDSSRRIGETVLPKGWLIVGLGNGPDDGAQYTGLKSVLTNRCAMYTIEPSTADWLQWATEVGIAPAIRAYIASYEGGTGTGGALHNYDPNSEDGALFLSPRAWVHLNDSLYHPNLPPTDPFDPLFLESCLGPIGLDNALKFTAFAQCESKLPDVDALLEGKLPPAESLTDSGLLMFTAQIIISKLRVLKKANASIIKPYANAMTWALSYQNLKKDTTVMLIRSISNGVNAGSLTLLTNEEFKRYCPGFTAFIKENAKLLR